MRNDSTNLRLAIGAGVDPVLRRREVAELLGVGMATLDRLRASSPDFPAPIRLSARRIGWRSSDIRAFVSICAGA